MGCARAAILKTTRRLFLVPDNPASVLADTFVPVRCLRCEREAHRAALATHAEYELVPERVRRDALLVWGPFEACQDMGAELDERSAADRRVFLARKV